MNANQFVVDLGNVKLTADHKKRINAAIQKAVTSELATLNVERNLVLVPVNNWPKGRGPIINGIIIREMLASRLKEVISEQGMPVNG